MDANRVPRIRFEAFVSLFVRPASWMLTYPRPRSGFSFLPCPDGVILHGGYCKEYVKGKRPVGVMLDDTWLLKFVIIIPPNLSHSMLIATGSLESQSPQQNKKPPPAHLRSHPRAKPSTRKSRSSGSAENVVRTPMHHLFVLDALCRCGIEVVVQDQQAFSLVE